LLPARRGRTISDVAGADDFDFLLGSWDVDNRRFDDERGWEEFSGRSSVRERVVGGLVQLDRFEADWPTGQRVEALTVRAFDPGTQEWSIVWLSNRQPHDFRPVVGAFVDGVGQFHQVIETADGAPLHVRFVWDEITDDSARWRQSLSLDGGTTWGLNWVMQLTRRT
jgi:hypothetical protein